MCPSTGGPDASRAVAAAAPAAQTEFRKIVEQAIGILGEAHRAKAEAIVKQSQNDGDSCD